MMTLEIEKFADFNKENVFRLSIVNDDLENLSNEDLKSYTNLRSLMIENNQNLKTIDLRGNSSIKYLCLGTCDNLREIYLDETVIENMDLYDLVSLESIELDTKQFLNLTNILSENITKQFLYLEDAILESFERKIKSTLDEDVQKSLLQAYEEYLETSQ